MDYSIKRPEEGVMIHEGIREYRAKINKTVSGAFCQCFSSVDHMELHSYAFGALKEHIQDGDVFK